MISLKIIREKPDRIKEISKQKNVDVDVDRLLELDKQWRSLGGQIAEIERKRNELAKSIKGKPTPEQIETGKQLRVALQQLTKEYDAAYAEGKALHEKVPNIPTDDTPIGPDESGNKTLPPVGEKPHFSFTPKEHWELGELLGVIDTERAAEVSGSRFAYLKGELVWLEFALVQYGLSILTNEGKLAEIAKNAGLGVPAKPFMPVIPPVLIKPGVMQKMARLEPKEERYHTPADDLYLVGSAEHTLGPLHMGEKLDEVDMPIRYVGWSTAFRRESGSYGKDVRGILRVHQFDKLEIESFTTPEAGIAEQNFIVAIQEYLMQSLKLPYQVVLKCTGDMGTPNARAIDIETWMPGQNRYRETHTSDYMSDFQARRLYTKVRLKSGKTENVHMNDATVFAIGRTLIAIMENNQQDDYSIDIPEVLQQYVPFKRIART